MTILSRGEHDTFPGISNARGTGDPMRLREFLPLPTGQLLTVSHTRILSPDTSSRRQSSRRRMMVGMAAVSFRELDELRAQSKHIKGEQTTRRPVPPVRDCF